VSLVNSPPDVVSKLSVRLPEKVGSVEADERVPEAEQDPLGQLAEAHGTVVTVATVQGGVGQELLNDEKSVHTMGLLHLTKSETRFKNDKTITYFFVVRPV
jgi:hypothetical protein